VDPCTVWIWYTLDFAPFATVNAPGWAAAQPSVVELELAHDVQALPRPRPRGWPSAAPWSAVARASVDVTYVLHRAVVGA